MKLERDRKRWTEIGNEDMYVRFERAEEVGGLAGERVQREKSSQEVLKEGRMHCSREQLKFKLEELIQLYLVLSSMGYHCKICTILYDDV